MKHFAAFLGLVIAFAVPQARAQSTPDDQYVSIYSLIQQADSLQAAGQPRQALNEYTQAGQQLQKFQKAFPDWNPRIVNFRLNYLAQKISALTAQAPAIPQSETPPSAAAGANAPPATSEPNAAPPAAAPDANTLQNLQAENATLQAKLREALSVQPVIGDTQELAMAQQQVKALLKENDLLRANAGQEKTEKPVSNAKDVKELQMSLAETKQKLTEQTARAEKLAQENQALQARPPKNSDAAKALRDENASLKKQVAELQSAAAGSTVATDTSAELAKLRNQVAALQSDADIQALANAALEKRLQQPQPAPAPVSMPQTPTSSTPQAPEETTPTPPSAEMTASAPETVATNVETKPVSDLPEGSAALVAEAQNYFSAHQYDKAEADYRQILQRDPNNALALANLAAIEMQENKLPDAEDHLRTALAQNPNDSYDLSIYGYLKFREQKFDEALDALTRAAKLDPKNPQIENYIGVTLSQKGQPAQAEEALLKAVELDPDYGAAHNNLAVIYLNEQPPKAELARWHYQKALASGQPHNPDLEKLLASKGAPVATQ